MKEFKGTPGPWVISELNRQGMFTNDGAAAILGGDPNDRQRIAAVDCQTPYKRGRGHEAKCEIRDANAALIAAAPALLEALQGFIKFSDARRSELGMLSDEMEYVVAKANAAITKALTPRDDR